MPDPPDTPSPTPQLLARDPAVSADDYPPAIWVPLSRVISARRRLDTMTRQLPPHAWQAPSACPGWTRHDVLAHLVAWDAQHLRSLAAVLAGDPLPVDTWRPDPAQPALTRDAWNAREVEARRDVSIADLAAAFAAGLTAFLERLARCDAAQLLHAYGFAPNVMAALEAHVRHVNAHADDIVNGPGTMRSG